MDDDKDARLYVRSLLVVAVTLAASLISARRASLLDPISALRRE